MHLDGCVEVEAAYYSVPPGWMSQRVAVQWNDLHVRVLAPRRILGVLSLARKHGPALTEDAAHFALEAGAPSYRCLRRYLERVTAPAAALNQIDPLIRQLTLYRDLSDRRAAAS